MPIWNATPPDEAYIWSFIMLLIDLDPKKRNVEWDKTGFNPLNDGHVAHFIISSVAIKSRYRNQQTSFYLQHLASWYKTLIY